MLAIAPTLLSWAASSGLGYHAGPPSITTTLRKQSSSFAATRYSVSSPSSRRRSHATVAMASDNTLTLPLRALSAGLTAAIELGVEQDAKVLAAGDRRLVDLRALELDEEELEGRKSKLLGELGDIEASGLVFQSDGAPTPSTLAVALVLTARHAAELDFPSIADLVGSDAHPAHASRAQLALSTVVSETLAEMEAAEQFTDASESASVSVNAPQEQTMEEARAMHMRWAILEMARARYAEDRPADWGSVGSKAS